jgi:hypothetical protein
MQSESQSIALRPPYRTTFDIMGTMKEREIGGEQQAATLADFIHFHGMLCAPRTAQRCIQAFQGASVLFLPHTYTRPLERFDYNNSNSRAIQFNPFQKLTLVTYYLLVWCSGTGLASWFGQTQCLVAEEFVDEPVVTVPPTDTASPETVDAYRDWNAHPWIAAYLTHFAASTAPDDGQPPAPLRWKRRFEFHFGGCAQLHVVMWHIQQGPFLHLVEVYRCDNPILRPLLHGLQAVCNRWWWPRTPSRGPPQ